jgi:replicative DNA helicase
MSELMPDFSLGVMERLGDPQEISGVTSGFKDLDEKLGGYKTGLHIIAGRPSMGKSRYMLSQTNRQIQYRIPVAILTLEMSIKQLMTALVAMRSDFTTQTIETGLKNGKPLTDDEQAKLKHTIHQLDDLPLFLKYGGGMDSLAVRATIDELILREQVKCVWVDYLQLFTDRGETRNLAIGNATRNLKTAADALDIPIIVLSQLNRATERTETKKPKLDELRDSGSIEQDADTVTMLYREDYYKAQTEKNHTPTGEAWAYIAKDRLGSGANKSVQFYFRPTKGSFEPVVKVAK